MEVATVQAFTVAESSEVAQARRGVSALAAGIGFDEQDLARISLVATEIGTNLVKYGRQGELLAGVIEDGETRGLDILGLDKGPGMADPAKCLVDGYSTAGSSGTGLGAIRRQSQSFDIYSRPGMGTGVLARIWPNPGTRQARERDGIDIGAVAVPKLGETACGDGWAWARRPDGMRILGVDGLGHGPLAAEAAGEAVRSFKARHHAGPAATLQDMHGALRATRGAAAAVADIDFADGRVTFAGVGNLSGTLLTGGMARRTVSHNGIVGHVQQRVKEMVYPYAPDTIFILHSDGLKTSWQLNSYPGLAQRRSSLIAGILYRDFKRGHDDALVVVAKRSRL